MSRRPGPLPPRTQTALQRYFNRSGPYLAAREMGPGVQAVMDGSLEWPIQRPVEVINFTAAVGFNIVLMAAPAVGQHMVIYSALSQAVGANPIQEAAMWVQEGIAVGAGLATDPMTIPLLWTVPLTIVTLRHLTPLIGTFVSTGASHIQGVSPVYLPFPNSLWFGIASNPAGQNVNIHMQSLTLPETQPFSSILDL